HRLVGKANSSGISAFQVFALMTDLGLIRFARSPRGPGCHPQQAISAIVRISQKRDSFPAPDGAGNPGPAGFASDNPSMIFHLRMPGITEIVKENPGAYV